eukprot:CAMPEP_0117812676 /NCGR_PEP_ID=MMETSP0948-20121206/22979_1 /TAXON_ID=44440 /ORGANISM="Chattonella subsalsa, Strain CCMP2191" /LENGTH=33 /DNA_ID= /DNA_START= /DNA_END= /DNA_ORIENTATION=
MASAPSCLPGDPENDLEVPGQSSLDFQALIPID